MHLFTSERKKGDEGDTEGDEGEKQKQKQNKKTIEENIVSASAQILIRQKDLATKQRARLNTTFKIIHSIAFLLNERVQWLTWPHAIVSAADVVNPVRTG